MYSENTDQVNVTQAEYYMQESFDLAKLALGRTSPNPIVGAIVLDKNGIPIAKGFHKKSGSEHAEVEAIKQAGEFAKGGTLVLNLEPCCHEGKTPPCTSFIIQSGIREVIFSNYDPNPLVDKKGEKILLEHNIKVISKVLESEGSEINKFFFKWIKTKTPWITLKQAQTLDSKVGLKNKNNKQITGDLAKKEVHNLRNIYDAILVGANTVQADDPQLTVRDVKGGRNPIRIILDPNLITNPRANVYKNNSFVVIATKQSYSKEKGSTYLKNGDHISILGIPENNNGRIDLRVLFVELGKSNILSILIEAGPTLSTELIQNSLIDEYILFISPQIFGSRAIPSLQLIESKNDFYRFKLFNYKAIGNDLMLSLRPVAL